MVIIMLSEQMKVIAKLKDLHFIVIVVVIVTVVRIGIIIAATPNST